MKGLLYHTHPVAYSLILQDALFSGLGGAEQYELPSKMAMDYQEFIDEQLAINLKDQADEYRGY